MQFLADMNISPLTVRTIKQQGYNIIRVSELMKPSVPDTEILEYARNHQMVILTQDIRDFSALIALNGYSQPSLINLRLSNNSPENIAQIFLKIIAEQSYQEALKEGCSLTIDDNKTRIRKLPIKLQ